METISDKIKEAQKKVLKFKIFMENNINKMVDIENIPKLIQELSQNIV